MKRIMRSSTHFFRSVLLGSQFRSVVTLFLCFAALQSIGQQPELTVQQGLKKFSHVALSGDGNYFSTHNEEAIQVWNARNGNLIRSLTADRGMYLNTWISKNGDFLFAGGTYDATWRRYTVADGKFIDSARNSKYYVRSIDYCEESALLATCSGDQSFTVWDLKSGRRMKVDSAHDIKIDRIQISADGKYVLTQGFETRLWDGENGKLIREFDVKTVSAALSRNGKYIALGEKTYVKGNDPQQISIWTTDGLKEIQRFTAHDDYIYSLDFSEDGSLLASGSGDASAKVWETVSGKLLHSFQIGGLAEQPDPNDQSIIYAPKYTGTVGTVDLSDNGQTLLTEFRQREIAIWDVKSGIKLSEPASGIEPVYSIDVNDRDELILATGNEVDILSLKDFSLIKNYQIANPRSVSLTGKVLTVLTNNGISSMCAYTYDTLHPARSTPVGFHGCSDYKNGNWVFPSGLGWVVINLDSGFVTCRVEATQEYRNPVCVSSSHVFYGVYGQGLDPQQQWVEMGSQEQRMVSVKKMYAPDKIMNGVAAFSLETCERTGIALEHDDEVSAMAYHEESDILAVCTRRGTIYFRKGKDLSLLSKTSISPDLKSLYVIHSARFNKSGNKLLMACSDKDLVEYDIREDALRYHVGHLSNVNAAVYNSDESRIISCSYDGTIKIWSSDGGLLSSLIVNGGNPLVYTPDFYYYAPKSRLSGLVFRIGKEVFPYYQFDMKYHRPDIVFERLGIGDPALIGAYREAHRKRLINSGIDANSLDIVGSEVPELRFASDDIPAVTDSRQFRFKTEFRSPGSPLSEYQVWVNGVPAGKSTWVKFGNEVQQSAMLEISVDLSSGKNKIEMACRTANGVESLKRSFDIIGPDMNEPRTTYVVAVSVSHFNDSEMDLKYAVKDGKDFIDAFADRSMKGRKVQTFFLFNSEVTPANLQKLKENLLKSKVDDEVLLYVSGHGLLGEDFTWYFAGTETNFDRPIEGGIPYGQIEGILDGIPARNRILFMDACHSGALDSDTTASKAPERAPELVSTEFGRKGGKTRSERSVSLQNSFQLMQDQFANLKRGAGVQVISAAAGDSYALESDKWQNGVFTYSLLKGLKQKQADLNKDGTIYFSELRDFVTSEVVKQTKGKQKPTMRMEQLERDIVLWE
ncbi:MAG: caspase family protein [Flavobacteriales bacterium]|nr:caspase family protein [Flavobacteriales bacterium]